MKKFKFLEWKIYNDAQDLFSYVLVLVKKIPKEHKYDLGSQATRSSLSVILNIAEGSGKSSDKELNRFLEIALGSLYETLAAIDTMTRNNFASQKDFEQTQQKIDSISSQIGGFKKTLATKL